MIYNFLQIPQLSQRDRAAGWVSYGEKRKTMIYRLLNSENPALEILPSKNTDESVLNNQ